jgi:subfamily B ATP-binding cassette protein MsbA
VLTQSLSKAAQRLIAELRTKVHAHVSRLPVSYYDANHTGALVTRVMNDVEGVRTIFGTGLIEFMQKTVDYLRTKGVDIVWGPRVRET